MDSVTALEYAFQRIPLISIPAVILDVGGGLGNLFQKINSKEVMPSDLAGLASSLVSFVGTFAMTASLGIEASAIGLNLLRISNLTNPIGIGLVVIGYALDHHAEIKKYLGSEGYELLKEQYSIAVNKFEETKDALKAHLGEPLFKFATETNHDNIEKILTNEDNGKLTYNFEYLDPTGSLTLKEKLKIDPSDLFADLNKYNAELDAEILSKIDLTFSSNNIIDPTINPFLTETEGKELQQAPPQDLFLSIDMSNTNLELIHLTKDDLRNSSLYTHSNWPGYTMYKNKDLPWLHINSSFVEIKDKFYFYNGHGINRGVAFPLFYDKTTKLPIGLPLNDQAEFTEMDALDVMIHSPHLFKDPGHIINNTGLQMHILNYMEIQSAFAHVNIGMSAIQDRLTTLKTINIDEIIKNNNDKINGISKILNHQSQSQHPLSISSGNAASDKYCFRYNDIDTSDFVDSTGKHINVVVEMCFYKNPYSEFE